MASLIVSHTDNGGGADFTPTPEGTHIAVCVSVTDLGSHFSEMYKKWNHQIALQWELPGETITIDGAEVPRRVTKTVGLSLHEKSALRKLLEAWRGSRLTEKDLKSFDLSALLGKGCQVTIVHNKSADGTKTYANVAGVVGLPKGIKAPAPSVTPVLFSLQEMDNAVFEALPEWMQEKIQGSKEWKAMDAEPEAVAPEAPKAEDEEDIGF